MSTAKLGQKIFTVALCLTVFLLVCWSPTGAYPAGSEWTDRLQSISDGRTLSSNDNAPELVEFFGFDCGFCVEYANETFPTVFRKLVKPGRINYRIKHYPLSTDPEGKAVQAHNATECAAEQNRFWPMKLLLIDAWPVSSGTDWGSFARRAGVPDLEQFQRCVQSDRYVDLILRHREDWSGGVPAFRLNGESWVGYRGPAGQISKINRVLGESGSPGIVSGGNSSVVIGDDVVIEDSGITQPSSHKVVGRIRYQNNTDRTYHLHIYGVKRNGRERLSGVGNLRPGEGTARARHTFETLNPQYDGDPNETKSFRGLGFRLYDRSHDQLIASWDLRKEFTLTLSGPPDGDPDRPADPSVNNFKNVWVELTDDTQARVHFDYNYRSNHGGHVFASAYFKNDGRQLSGWAYRPHELDPRDGAGTVVVTFRDWNQSDLPKVTDGIKLKMYVGGEGEFYEEHVKLRVKWGGNRTAYGRGRKLKRTSDGSADHRDLSRKSNEGLLDNIESGALTDTSMVDPDTPFKKIKLSQEDWSSDQPSSRSADYTITRKLDDRLSIDVMGGFDARGRSQSLRLDVGLPRYPTLNIRRLQSLSRLSGLRWETVKDARTGEKLNIEHQSTFREPAMELQNISYGPEFSHRFSLDRFPDRLRGRGVYSHLLPTEVSAYLVSTRRHLPWSVPGTDVSIKRERANKFIVTPDPEAKLLGLVGFDTAGERIRWSSNSFRFRDGSIQAAVDFRDNNPAYLMVVRLDDYEIRSIPFLLSTSIDTRVIDPEEANLVEFGSENFFVAEYDYHPGLDTTLVKITSDSTGRRLQSSRAINGSGEKLNAIRWSRGSGNNHWNYRLAKTWRGRVDKIVLLGLRDVSIKPDETNLTPSLFYPDQRERLLEKHRDQQFEVVDYRVDTGPHHLDVTLKLNTSSLNEPVPVIGYPKTKLTSLSGSFWKVIEPGQESVSFQYRGIGHSDWEKPHLNGWVLNKRTPFYQIVYAIDSLEYSFDGLNNANEGQKPASKKTEVTIDSVDINSYSVGVTGRVKHGVSSGRVSYLILSIDERSKLDPLIPRREQDIHPRSLLLLEPEERFQVKLTKSSPNGVLNAENLNDLFLGVFVTENSTANKRPSWELFETEYEDAIPMGQFMSE